MADNISSGVANNVLALLLNGTAYAGFTATFVQLHTGAPGANGVSNVAGNNVRQPAGAFTAPAGGATANSAAINWTSVSTSETYSHASLWSAASGGIFICSGALSASAITAGQNFQIAIGGLTVSIPVAS